MLVGKARRLDNRAQSTLESALPGHRIRVCGTKIIKVAKICIYICHMLYRTKKQSEDRPRGGVEQVTEALEWGPSFYQQVLPSARDEPFCYMSRYRGERGRQEQMDRSLREFG